MRRYISSLRDRKRKDSSVCTRFNLKDGTYDWNGRRIQTAYVLQHQRQEQIQCYKHCIMVSTTLSIKAYYLMFEQKIKVRYQFYSFLRITCFLAYEWYSENYHTCTNHEQRHVYSCKSIFIAGVHKELLNYLLSKIFISGQRINYHKLLFGFYYKA